LFETDSLCQEMLRQQPQAVIRAFTLVRRSIVGLSFANEMIQ